ncbi:MAG: DUF2436 domain-containing protein [Bacteroidales bacterium]|jgi:gingipain R/gingipain K|nr:DUF2436 domain-containing protein [Bacteroidales bacterium]
MKKLLSIALALTLTIGSISAQDAKTLSTPRHAVRTEVAPKTHQILPSQVSNTRGNATIVVTVGDVWGDGTGYQLLLDADHTAYGTTIPASGNLSTNCTVASTLYDVFEYKMPTNANPSCTSTNILFNSTTELSIPAGTYDFCFANPTPGDKIYIANTSATSWGRANDYVFEENKTYTFTIALVGNNDNVAVVVTNAGCSTPTNLAATATGNITWTGHSETAWNVVVSTFPLSNPSTGTIIPVTSTTYQATGLQAASTYYVYVQANCGGSALSTWTDAVSFTTPCEGAVTVFPFTESFEDAFPPACWTMIDADGDGHNWGIGTAPGYVAHTGVNTAISASWLAGNIVLHPDNYLITPQLSFPIGTASLKYWVKGQDPDYVDEHYEIKVSTTTNSASAFTSVFQETIQSAEWVERTVDLSNYAGQNIYVAFVHNNSSDVFVMCIDDVTIDAVVDVKSNDFASFNVYPNPTSGAFTMSFGNYTGVYNCIITDVKGSVVYEENGIAENSKKLNLNVANGIYFVKISNNNEVVTTKIVVK